jgi:hypothetical protein
MERLIDGAVVKYCKECNYCSVYKRHVVPVKTGTGECSSLFKDVTLDTIDSQCPLKECIELKSSDFTITPLGRIRVYQDTELHKDDIEKIIIVKRGENK